ncbi:hypothetical protein FDECE_4319 [Fusarium decemcellulare]|nr:hypothetical protein FDECE_4319 [Fusarium decemcellulare]
MSFGYAVGDVIAVLGLFERVAIELRNYKDAPAHFQQLRAELDLVHGTLKHVLQLEPESQAERQTLEQIRAIVVHCSQPLQSMVDKMRFKEGTLGHFRTTRSLSNIGTRLHWSMVAQSDVDGLRKTMMSQMAAINILLSVQQLTRVRQLASQSKSIQTCQSLVIEKHANAIAGHATTILKMVSRTQGVADDIAANAATQAKIQAEQSEALNRHLTAMETNIDDLAQKTGKATAMVRRHAASVSRHAKTLFSLMQEIKALIMIFTNYSKEMLEAIGRNARMLLDIRGQLKRILTAIEAIPLHLTLDIVRLDDAHGDSWALPLQACRTWSSFCDLLNLVVYANGRPGADLIRRNHFDITLAKTGMHINMETWSRTVKPGLHIEQAMVVSRGRSSGGCVDPGCAGTVVEQALELDERRRVCAETLSSDPYRQAGTSRTTPNDFGPQLPSEQANDNIKSFRRVRMLQNSEPVHNTEDALSRLRGNITDSAANAFLGFELLRNAEEHNDRGEAQRSVYHFETAVRSDISVAENWYLLARACIRTSRFHRAHEALQSAIRLDDKCPSFWITAGTLFFMVNQYRDSWEYLHRAARLSPHLVECWHNFGVLYEYNEGGHEDAVYAFTRCLNLDPAFQAVRARLRVLQSHAHDSDSEVPINHFIGEMMETPLQVEYESF